MASETEEFDEFVKFHLRGILEARFAKTDKPWSTFINDYAKNGTLGSDLARWKREREKTK